MKKGRNMKWAPFFLGFLMLAGACVVEDKSIVPDGSVEAGGCGACPADKPVCLDDVECVECTENDDDLCTERSQICNVELSECVDCLRDSDCTAPGASVCNLDANECEPCETDTQCNDVDGLPPTNNACDDRECVDCTPETEADSCPEGDSCNPVTNVCSGIQPGTRETCEPCVSDRDCGDEGNRCVPMDYQEERFPDEESGFCLKSIDLGGPCVNPYRIVITRTSLSGADPDAYCGINEELATCRAVRALVTDTRCDPENEDADCPQPSGLCENLTDGNDTCTYRCNEIQECLTEPVPGWTCGFGNTGGAGGAATDRYCGG